MLICCKIIFRQIVYILIIVRLQYLNQVSCLLTWFSQSFFFMGKKLYRSTSDLDYGILLLAPPPQSHIENSCNLKPLWRSLVYMNLIQLVWKISHHIRNSFIGELWRLVYGAFIIWQGSSHKIQQVIYKGIRSNHFYQQPKNRRKSRWSD